MGDLYDAKVDHIPFYVGPNATKPVGAMMAGVWGTSMILIICVPGTSGPLRRQIYFRSHDVSPSARVHREGRHFGLKMG